MVVIHSICIVFLSRWPGLSNRLTYTACELCNQTGEPSEHDLLARYRASQGTNSTGVALNPHLSVDIDQFNAYYIPVWPSWMWWSKRFQLKYTTISNNQTNTDCLAGVHTYVHITWLRDQPERNCSRAALIILTHSLYIVCFIICTLESIVSRILRRNGQILQALHWNLAFLLIVIHSMHIIFPFGRIGCDGANIFSWNSQLYRIVKQARTAWPIYTYMYM